MAHLAVMWVCLYSFVSLSLAAPKSQRLHVGVFVFMLQLNGAIYKPLNTPSLCLSRPPSWILWHFNSLFLNCAALSLILPPYLSSLLLRHSNRPRGWSLLTFFGFSFRNCFKCKHNKSVASLIFILQHKHHPDDNPQINWDLGFGIWIWIWLGGQVSGGWAKVLE